MMQGGDREEERWLTHYSSKHEILLVGDGDFSFSLSLALSFASATHILATSLDSYDDLIKKYKKAKFNLQTLKSLGAAIVHGVDATKMKCHVDLISRRFDRIIFNFPHTGFRGKERDWLTIQRHRMLLNGFFSNAKSMLRMDGEIHVNHKTTAPFSRWRLDELGLANNLILIECVEFKREDYPFYEQKRGDSARCDEPFPLGESSTFKFRVCLSFNQRVGYQMQSYGNGHRFGHIGGSLLIENRERILNQDTSNLGFDQKANFQSREYEQEFVTNGDLLIANRERILNQNSYLLDSNQRARCEQEFVSNGDLLIMNYERILNQDPSLFESKKRARYQTGSYGYERRFGSCGDSLMDNGERISNQYISCFDRDVSQNQMQSSGNEHGFGYNGYSFAENHRTVWNRDPSLVTNKRARYEIDLYGNERGFGYNGDSLIANREMIFSRNTSCFDSNERALFLVARYGNEHSFCPGIQRALPDVSTEGQGSKTKP